MQKFTITSEHIQPVKEKIIKHVYLEAVKIYERMLEDKDIDLTFTSPCSIPEILSDIVNRIKSEMMTKKLSLEIKAPQTQNNNLDQIVDRIFIINLKRREDRWKNITEQLSKNNITNYERFDAVEYNFQDIPTSHYNNMNLSYPRSINCDVDKYRVGACGCKSSHVEIMRIAKERGYKRIAVIEDDAEFINNIEEVPEDFDMLMLAGTFYSKDQPISKHLYRIPFCLTTLGYIINSHMFDMIIEHAEKSGVEIDVFYRSYIHTRGKTFMHNPHVLGSLSDFSDVIHQKTNYDQYGI